MKKAKRWSTTQKHAPYNRPAVSRNDSSPKSLTLENAGLDDNTIVIFTSDNGPERLAYDRIQNYSHKSMGELRGLKRDIWEGGHRVPFIIRWPGKINAGHVSNEVISQVDLLATLAKITGY